MREGRRGHGVWMSSAVLCAWACAIGASSVAACGGSGGGQGSGGGAGGSSSGSSSSGVSGSGSGSTSMSGSGGSSGSGPSYPCGAPGTWSATCPAVTPTTGPCAGEEPFSWTFNMSAAIAENGGSWVDDSSGVAENYTLDVSTCALALSGMGNTGTTCTGTLDLKSGTGSQQQFCDDTCSPATSTPCTVQAPAGSASASSSGGTASCTPSQTTCGTECCDSTSTCNDGQCECDGTACPAPGICSEIVGSLGSTTSECDQPCTSASDCPSGCCAPLSGGTSVCVSEANAGDVCCGTSGVQCGDGQICVTNLSVCAGECGGAFAPCTDSTLNTNPQAVNCCPLSNGLSVCLEDCSSSSSSSGGGSGDAGGSCTPSTAHITCDNAGYIACTSSYCCPPSAPYGCVAMDMCFTTEAAAAAACGSGTCLACGE